MVLRTKEKKIKLRFIDTFLFFHVNEEMQKGVWVNK